MTINDLLPPVPYEVASQYAIVMTARAAEALLALQESHENNECVARPLPLDDGRFFLCADILTETAPGGLLHDAWTRIDLEKFSMDVEVMEWSALPKRLLPQAAGEMP
jgi:hypothetical protein